MKHKDELEVAALALMPLKSTRRRMHLRKLLNDGNYQHNVDVLAKKRGEIIPLFRLSPVHSVQMVSGHVCQTLFK